MKEQDLILKYGNPKNWTNSNLFSKTTEKTIYPHDFVRLIGKEVDNRGGIEAVKTESEKEKSKEKEKINAQKQKSKSKIKYAIYAISSLLMIFIIVFIITTKERREFEKAFESKSVIELQNFLGNYPESKFNSDVKLKIVELDYEYAIKKNTIVSLENFLKKYPNSEYADQAIQKLIEIEIIEAKRINTIPAYEEIAKKYPDSSRMDEIAYLLACKKNNLEGYHSFLSSYPNSIYKNKIANNILTLRPEIQKIKDFEKNLPGKDYYSYIKQEINDILFLKYSPIVIRLLNKNRYSSEELIKNIDKLCIYPPSEISYNKYRQFQLAINRYQKVIEKNDGSNNPVLYYSFAELMYHVSNAIGKSGTKIMLESLNNTLKKKKFDLNGLISIDVFKITEAAQSLIDYLLIFIMNDDNVETRHRGIVALDRITKNNSIAFSKRWTNGEKVKGLEISKASIPINLKSILTQLEKIEKLETNIENTEMIKRIKSRISF